MMTCIAIDDEPLALSVIEALCSRMPELKLLATFTSTTAAIQYLAENEVDLLFLDVEMPNLNGVDFYRENGADQLVIFITAHRDFAVEGFSVNAIDYLLKPVTFDRFKQAIDKALSYQAHQKSDQPAGADSLYVRSEYALVKIRFNEIL